MGACIAQPRADLGRSAAVPAPWPDAADKRAPLQTTVPVAAADHHGAEFMLTGLPLERV